MKYINSKKNIQREFKKAQHDFFIAKKIGVIYNLCCILAIINGVFSMFIGNFTWGILFVLLIPISLVAKIQLIEIKVQNMRYWATKYTILYGWGHK